MKIIKYLALVGVLVLTSFSFKTTSPSYWSISSRKNHLALGNPTNAIHDPAHSFNYLMEKEEYTLSYNASLGHSNWVSWHLDADWMGAVTRCEGQSCFISDKNLPFGYFRVSHKDYTGSGFDRGHVCPSADRTKTEAENRNTFLMTNMCPQAPNLNQQTWRLLEDYCQSTLIPSGNECYIIAGGHGTGGDGSKGKKDKIAGGNVNVPSTCWKIVVVVPSSSVDISRIDTLTRIIAVQMPNSQSIDKKNWGKYRVSVDSLEEVTGFDFLSSVPESIQKVIESKIDKGPTK